MKEEAEYYFENGFLVFTKHYHLKRGYCCKNGCRHCPWQYQANQKQQTKSAKMEL
ncbi:MAG TPA: DUF5522 domain-containing protein [Pedobacter sp.]|jgi:hypothetical protein